ncbi:MAG TPA: altronate dehydrogenase [Planctomycetaceae bacterium]|nr:altronate dehydrogenase [Planctomycetaceae bacterium]
MWRGPFPGARPWRARPGVAGPLAAGGEHSSFGTRPAPPFNAQTVFAVDGCLGITVLQFGTGKFLRAFADLFIHELNEGRAAAGRVVAVQSTGTERAEQLNRQGGRYRVAIRGREAGRLVDRVVEVQSISRALAASKEWPEVLEVARLDSLELVISNATEAGYAVDSIDRPADAPPRSFPGKLLQVLKARYEAGLPAVTVLPCELLEQNAVRLSGLVLRLAGIWGLAVDLVDWIHNACRWSNTLVDRIVATPAPDDPLAADPLAAVAEPFALWLVEGHPGPVGDHPSVDTVDDLGPYHLRKVRILNGAHTALVAKAMPMGIQTVRQAVEDPRIRPWLESLLFEEIVPVLEGRTEQPEPFARTVLERFANPFLEHRLADIALHHDVKLRTRLAPTRDEFRRRFGRRPPILEEILGEA